MLYRNYISQEDLRYCETFPCNVKFNDFEEKKAAYFIMLYTHGGDRRTRYLDPSIGRWLTRDSFEDFSPAGLNKYQDCENNPVNFTDPLGMDPTDSNSSDNIFTTIGNIFGNMISGVIGFAVGVGEGIVGAGVSLVGGITGNQSIIEAGRNILADAQKNISYSLYLAQNLSSSYQQNEQNYMIKYHTLPAGIIAGINENRMNGLGIKPYEQSIYNEAMKNGSNVGLNSKGLLYTHTMDSELNNPDNMIAYNDFGNGAVGEDGMTSYQRMLRRLTENGSDLDYSNLSFNERTKKIWEEVKRQEDSKYTIVDMSDANAGEEIKADIIEQLKKQQIDSNTGNPYVIINGNKIEFSKSELSNTSFDESNKKEIIGGNTNLVLAVKNTQAETFIGLVKFAAANQTQNGEPLTISSMWRPQTGDVAHHEGRAIDFSSFTSGTQVNAAESGTVKLSEYGTADNGYYGYGNSVVIQGSNGTEYLYAHNNSVKPQNGSTINAGDWISSSGNTGSLTTTPYPYHVHFEVKTSSDQGYIK